MRVVPRAHRGQRSTLMISEFVIGIAMIRAEHAAGTRMASRSAIGFHLHSMSQAIRDVPTIGERNCTGGTSGNTTSRHASGTWVEAERITRQIQIEIDNQRGAKRDPRTVDRMDDDADYTGTAKAGELGQFDKVQRRTGIDERIDGLALSA